MLESVKGRTLTDKQCAKILLRSFEALVATEQETRESLETVEWNFGQTLRDLKEFDDLASEKPLTPAERAIYGSLIDELKELIQLRVQRKKYLAYIEERAPRILLLVDQLMASITDTKSSKRESSP